MPVQPGYEASPLSELQEDSLLDIIDQGFGQALRDIWDFGTDLPGLVAREGPESPPVAAIKPILRLACRRYARGEGPESLPAFDAAWGSICEPYLESIGEMPVEGELGPPFTGGQCYTGYSYIYSFRNPNTGEIQDSFQTISGRILGLFERVNSNGVTKTGGVERQLSPGAPVDQISLGTTNIGAPLDQSIRNVQRIDGLPDNCGNPPSFYDPPKVRPDLPVVGPQPIRFPGIGPINVDVNFDPDGTIVVKLPDVGIEVPIEDPFGFGDGDGDGGGDGGGGGDSGPSDGPVGDPGTPGAPSEPGPGGESSGCAPQGSVLTGVKVDILAMPETPKEYAPGVYRGVCYVYMGTEGALDHDPAGAMLRNGQFIFAEKDNLTCYAIRANKGWSLRITPYYRSVES